jgi:alkylation response protein AidB-like acyl-CoA dehydrogenase
MSHLIVDPRDQRFVLYEMLGVEQLLQTEMYSAFSRDVFDMALSEADKLAVEVLYPSLSEGDREGCRLENGRVSVPKCFHRCYQLYREGGWMGMTASPEVGGHGFPIVIGVAAKEWFVHNDPMLSYPFLTEGAAHLIAVYGTEKQKRTYMDRMYAGVWGGTMCLTEADAGSDVGNIKTRAYRRPDGTFRIKGTKQFITGGDHDLVDNIINPVLARIEGDPPGTGGISIFLVPKYLVNDDGSLGRRNDYAITAIEEKMGLHGSATCAMVFGDNDECYAELLGEERQGIRVMFQLMNEARIGVGIQAVGVASIAYLHALLYAKERFQGSALEDMKNPEAPRVPIIRHADVRRMLLWMKAHVEGMRAMVYYTAHLADRVYTEKDEAVRETWHGLIEILTPICKAYCSDMAFRVAEMAVQVYGGYGYCSEYPVEQFLRDIKIASLWEGTNGIQALDLVGRKIGLKKGMHFMNLLGEMSKAPAVYKDHPDLKDLAANIQQAINALAETAMYFAICGKAGKYVIPVSNASPFLMMMGKVIMGWLLLWEAGVAHKMLHGAAVEVRSGMPDADFYTGKIAAARYFIKHVLPEVEAAVKAIRSEDLSALEIPEGGFAS